MECQSNYFHSHYNAPNVNYAYLYSPISSPLHRHEDFYEFSLITHGSFINEYNGRKQTLHKNTLIYFRCGEAHSIFAEREDSLHFTVIIKKELFEELCEHFFLNSTFFFTNPYASTALTNLQGEFLYETFKSVYMHSPSPDLPNSTRFFLYNLMALIQPLALTMPVERTIDRYVDKLLNELNHYAYQDIKISRIYQEFPIAHSTLISGFRKRTGYTIEQYLGIKKMEHAATLLRETDKTLSEVCAIVGFSALSHFIQKFKKHHGVTPKEYQRIAHMDKSIINLTKITNDSE